MNDEEEDSDLSDDCGALTRLEVMLIRLEEGRIPKPRLNQRGQPSCWEASPGRPSRGSSSPKPLSRGSTAVGCAGIPVADAMFACRCLPAKTSKGISIF